MNGTIVTEGSTASIVSVDSPNSQMGVDGGTWSNGDTISKTSTYDASLTCSSSTELANMVGPISMTDENGDLVTPQTSEIVSVASSGLGTTYETMGSSDANANWNQASAVQYNVGQAPASGSAATILVKAFSGAVFGIAGNFTNTTKNIAISVSDDGTNWTGLGDYSQLDLNVVRTTAL